MRGTIALDIAGRLRSLRMSRGFSQTVLGDMIGVTHQMIQKYEMAGNRIPIDRLEKIAEVLEVPVSYFFETLGPVTTPDELDAMRSFYADPMGFRVARAFIRLPKQARRAAVEIIESAARIQPAE